MIKLSDTWLLYIRTVDADFAFANFVSPVSADLLCSRLVRETDLRGNKKKKIFKMQNMFRDISFPFLVIMH